MPDIEFKLLNESNLTVKLSDFQGKLVILDFWATWCGSCMEGFKKSDSIQKVFEDKVQILLINSSNRIKADSKQKLDNFQKKWLQMFPDFKLPFVFEDTLAYSLFPHSGIPHYVWIDPDGKVIATTSSITSDKITKILNGQSFDIGIKDGYFLDVVYINGITPINLGEVDNYSFFKKGEIKNVKSIIKSLKVRVADESKVVRIVARNSSLINIYKEAVKIQRAFHFTGKRLLVEVADTIELYKNIYSYDLIVPETGSEDIYNIMIGDLNRYTSFYAGFENRVVKCLVLTRTTKEDKLKSKGVKTGSRLKDTDSQKYIYNRGITHLVSALEKREGIKLPVLDETGYYDKVDIELNYFGDDLLKLKAALQPYGLTLLELEREIQMFVIRDNNK